MKKIVRSLMVTTMAVLLFTAPASAFLNDWYLDIDGPGGFDPVQVNELLDIVGPSYIINTFTSPTDFTFDDYGFFTSVQHDGGNLFPWVGTYELTAIFQGEGTGTLGSGILFTGGTIDIYAGTGATRNFGTVTSGGDSGIFYGANDGDLIASFSLITGDGTIDATGVPNGEITLLFESTFLRAGTWFDSSMKDLSLLPQIEWLLGFATTNASYVANPSAPVVTEFSAFSGTAAENGLPFTLFVSTNGQYRLDVIPEPSTILLLGGGLLGLGFVGYRRRNAKK